LLNALLRSERAIVTPIAGTTRDTVEEVANLRGIPLHLIDTAGITPTDDPVEQIGVQRSRTAAETSDVILLVFDGAEPLTEQDRQVSQEVQAMDRPVILVVNKADRPQRLEIDQLRNIWPDVGDEGIEKRFSDVMSTRRADTSVLGTINRPLLMTSTLTGTGLSALEATLADLVLGGKTIQGESALVTSARHQEALRRAAEHLRASLVPLQQALPLDFVSIDLRAAYDALGEITGETASEDLLERIFSEFCIGK
jgi:tRNA modification GTPase